MLYIYSDTILGHAFLPIQVSLDQAEQVDHEGQQDLEVLTVSPASLVIEVLLVPRVPEALPEA